MCRFQAGADVVLVKIASDATTAVLDYFAAGYGTPSRDAEQNIDNLKNKYVNGMVEAEFDRPLATTDADNDAQFVDDNCYYFLFPTMGGPLAAEEVRSISVLVVLLRTCACFRCFASLRSTF